MVTLSRGRWFDPGSKELFFLCHGQEPSRAACFFDNHSVGNSIVHAIMEIHAIHQAELLDITLLVCRLLKSHPATPAAGVV